MTSALITSLIVLLQSFMSCSIVVVLFIYYSIFSISFNLSAKSLNERNYDVTNVICFFFYSWSFILSNSLINSTVPCSITSLLRIIKLKKKKKKKKKNFTSKYLFNKNLIKWWN